MADRVVCDTSVYFSRYVTPQGSAAKLVDASLARGDEILASPHLLKELQERLVAKGYATQAEATHYADRLRDRVCTVVEEPSRVHTFNNSPEDSFIADIAARNQATLVVTYDKRSIPELRAALEPRCEVLHGSEYQHRMGLTATPASQQSARDRLAQRQHERAAREAAVRPPGYRPG